MKVFSKDVWICATAYVVADSEEEAQKLLDAAKDSEILFPDRIQTVGADVVISGAEYEHLKNPINLSPAMTWHGEKPNGELPELADQQWDCVFDDEDENETFPDGER